MKQKATYGSPCNSCGQCCQASLCPLASAILGKPLNADGPCPMLTFKDGDSTCGVVADPAAFAPVKCAIYGVDTMREAALFLIGAGFGCDGQVDDEPGNPEFKARIMAYCAREAKKRNRSIILWGLDALGR